MYKTSTLVYLSCFVVVLSILGLVEFTNTDDTKTDTVTTSPPIKYETSTQDSTEYLTSSSTTDATQYTETPPTTAIPAVVVHPEFGRSCWIILTAGYGVFFLVLAIMFITGCLKLNCDFCRNHCGHLCHRKSFKPPETVAYSLNELTMGSLSGSVSQENSEAEGTGGSGGSDSLPELIPEHLVDSSELERFHNLDTSQIVVS